LVFHGRAGALENRRCAGRLAAARPLWCVGRYCLRHLWPDSVRGNRRGQSDQSTDRQRSGRAYRAGRRVPCLWRDQAVPGAAIESRAGVLRRRPVDPQDRCRQP
nr:hypothetical protein [Tanacetum cinerariifolium]